MKDKILTLIIGILIGAIITAGVFLIINKNSSNSNVNQNDMMGGRRDMSNFVGGGMNDGNPAKSKKNSTTNTLDGDESSSENQAQGTNNDMPNGVMGGTPPDGGKPPEMPSGSNNGNPPQMPSQNNQSSSSI